MSENVGSEPGHVSKYSWQWLSNQLYGLNATPEIQYSSSLAIALTGLLKLTVMQTNPLGR